MSRREDALSPTPTMPAPAGRAPRAPSFFPGRSRVPGRPAYLTPETQERFMTALRAGNTFADAARYCGLPPNTVYKWLKRGRGDDPDRPPTPEYVAFMRLAEESRAAAKVYVVGNLVARSRVDTRAAEVWLRVHGGEEWSDSDAPAPASPASPTYIDAREQHIQAIVLPPDQIPDAVRQLLAQRRSAMPLEPDIVTEEPRPHGPSRARDAKLREDG